MTYQQIYRYVEHGGHDVTIVFVISDTYDGLLDLDSAPVVNIFDIDSSKWDLDLSAATFAEDSITFDINEDAAASDDDWDAVRFALDSQDPAQKRFCAIYINPADPVDVGDAAFRGVLLTGMRAEAIEWEGEEFDTVVDPLWTWHCDATSFDVGHILDADLKTLVASIDSEWIAANVADRLGSFYRESGVDAYGHRELRFANLVAVETLFQKLLDLAAPSGITMTYESADTDLYVYRGGWIAHLEPDGRVLRYSTNGVNSGEGINPWHYVASDRRRLIAGGSPSSYASMWISWRLLTPTQEEEAVSWLQCKSLAELIFGIARTLGMYVDIRYETATDIRLTMKSRGSLQRGPVYLRDSTKAEMTVSQVDADQASKKFIGNANPVIREGNAGEQYDGGMIPQSQKYAALTTGEQLLLTISPSWCILSGGRGEDAGFPIGKRYAGAALIPVNGVFWDSASARKPQAAAGMPEYNAECAHTAIYIRVPGRDDDETIGMSGRDGWLPVLLMQTQIGGADRFYARMADFANDLYERDEAYFQAEYQLTVPGLLPFRSAPDGTSDWRNLQLGCTMTLDGVDWIVVGIERRYRDVETIIRLHHESRFAWSTPEETDLPEPPTGRVLGPPSAAPAQVSIESGAAYEAMSRGIVAARRSDGSIERARARHEHYERIIGLVMQDVEINDVVDVQRSGTFVLDAGAGMTPGTRLFVRTAPPGTWNVSTTPLLAVADPEDLFAPIGRVETADSISITLHGHAIIEPRLPDA